MPKYRVSRARQWRKALVRLYGRVSLPRPRRPSRTPAYRKVLPTEVLQFHAWAGVGWSARRIARYCGRDHHTVCRWLGPSNAVRRLMRPPTVENLREATRVAAWVADDQERRRLLEVIIDVRLRRQDEERAGWRHRTAALRQDPPGVSRHSARASR